MLQNVYYLSYVAFEVWKEKSTGRKTIRCIYNGDDIPLLGKIEPELKEFLDEWKEKYTCKNRELECQVEQSKIKVA